MLLSFRLVEVAWKGPILALLVPFFIPFVWADGSVGGFVESAVLLVLLSV